MVYFGLGAEEYDRKYSDKKLVNSIIAYFKPYKHNMERVVFFVFLSSIANGFIPLVISRIINNVNISSDLTSLILLSALTFGLNLIGFVSNYFQKLNSAKAINNVVLDLQKDATDAIIEKSLTFFDKFPTGKVVSRVSNDTKNFGEMMNLFMESVASLFVVVVVIIPMFIINVNMTLILLALIPAVFAVALSFRKVARKKTLLGQRATANVNSYIGETMRGIMIAKTFRQEEKFYQKFKNVNSQCYRINLKRALVLNILFPILFLLQNLVVSFLIYYGGEQILYFGMPPGDFYLFIQNVWVLFFPIFQIASFWPQFQSGLSAAERVFSLIEAPQRLIQTGERELNIQDGSIQIKDLSFQYNEDTQVFKDFSLNIMPGESIAVVGHTGAGKSTLAKVLGRFYEYQEGSICIDGVDIRNLDLKSFRKQIGFIPQTPFIWGTTLRKNVEYGNLGAEDSQIRKALIKAGGFDWVEDLPNGLDTDLKEGGKILSMGQRQLVAFARILLADPKILILDEATASVDPFTETRIQTAMERTMSDRTTIIIAHRLWTVRNVDRIIVFDHGKIIEEGDHETLMKKGGYYSQLYKTYFKHQSYEYIEQMGKKN